MSDHDRTSARLVGVRGQSVRTYLTDYLADIERLSDSEAEALARFLAASSKQAKEAKETTQALGLKGSGESAEEEQMEETPLYIKTKGKGKGRAVMFEPGKSCVAQVFDYAAQMSLFDPIFKHTKSGAAHFPRFTVKVTFDGLSATNGEEFASSIKEAKEQACSVLVERILRRNREVYGLRA